jgi:hypothetical protein
MGDQDEGRARSEAPLRDPVGERRPQPYVDEDIAELVVTPLDQSAAEVMAQTLTGGNTNTGNGSRPPGGSR